MPILTWALSKQHFGAYVIFAQIVMSLQMVMSALFGSAILRLRIDFEGDDQKGFLATIFLAAGVVQLLLAAVLALAGHALLPWLYPNLAIPLGLLPLYVGVWSLVMTTRSLALTLIKSLELPRRVLVLNLVYGAALILFLWLFLGDGQGDITSALQAMILAESVAMLAAFGFLARHLSGRMRLAYLRHSLHFTGPLVFGTMLFALVLNLDGVVLARYIDLSAMGVYGLGAILGKSTAIAVTAYISSYSTRLINLYGASGRTAVEGMLPHVMKDNLTLLTVVTLGVVMCAEGLVQLLAAGPGYAFAAWVLAGGAVANLCRSVFQVYYNGLFIVKRTGRLLMFNALLLVVTAIVMVLLAEAAGASGVAFGLAVAYLLLSIPIAVSARSDFRWRFPWPSFARSVASVVAVLVGTLVILDFGWGFHDSAFWATKAIQTALVAVFWAGPLWALLFPERNAQRHCAAEDPESSSCGN
ncbi:lipopolysaccharide biosynthesis protein [Brevundimonas sp.]|uniref:lipopolysaccharide biosynthesis protein n=1 Tax=Brevundimonas sp. TaxID=1871086 RepID=UPI002737B1DE|nr:hypothetical protein [Brevundimonas sp.]MDP3802990.1 hypothetical protein [Brevundimonas sp.]